MNYHTPTDTLHYEQRLEYLAEIKAKITALSSIDTTTRLVENEHCHTADILDLGGNGYPQVRFLYPHKTKSRVVKVSRILMMCDHYYLAGRCIRTGAEQLDKANYRIALHKCHNQSCVNPNHIYVGTPEMNVYDYFVSDHNTGLAYEDVLFILSQYKYKHKHLASELGEALQMHPNSIREIWNGIRYPYINRDTLELVPPHCDTLKVGAQGVYKDGITYAFGRG